MIEKILPIIMICYAFNYIPGILIILAVRNKWHDWLWLVIPLGFFRFFNRLL